MSATRPPAFDDRFTTPTEASRRGAHRARPKAVSVGLPIIAGVAVVLIVLGFTYTLLNSGKSSSGANVSAADTTSSASATKSAGSGKATATSSAAQTSSAATSTAGGTRAVNRGIDLKVLNSIPVQGLAKKLQTRIEGDGWKVQSTGNSKNRNLVTTKIYYGMSSTKASATALRKDIGYGILVLDSAVAGNGLVVVLGQDAA